MHCVILNCTKEANLPYFACGPQHGFDWKNIQEAIKGSYEYYSSYPYPKKFNAGDIEYYKQFMKVRKENDGTN